MAKAFNIVNAHILDSPQIQYSIALNWMNTHAIRQVMEVKDITYYAEIFLAVVFIGLGAAVLLHLYNTVSHNYRIKRGYYNMLGNIGADEKEIYKYILMENLMVLRKALTVAVILSIAIIFIVLVIFYATILKNLQASALLYAGLMFAMYPVAIVITLIALSLLFVIMTYICRRTDIKR